METSEIVHTVETLHRDARERKLFFQFAEDERLTGRTVTVHGRAMVSFGSCSYLGLEFHPELVRGVCDAAMRYGTQFSCSRGYLSLPLYQELEGLFDRIFEGHTVLAPTTTLAHHAAFDALMNEKDALVLDHQVHQSVHQAANVARTRGAFVTVVKHEELERAEEVIAALARRHRTVWFCMDGVLSMYGDLAPFALLRRLLDVAPNVRLYIDDAHGMSWMGKHGRGSFLEHMPLSPRLVVATSLAKAFGCGGGLLVFASADERDRVRLCGGTLLFSGPIQPPMLGAALASARLHLTDEITGLQDTLRARVRLTNGLIKDAGLPLLIENDVPIRFIRLGLPRVACEVAERLAAEGIHVNVSMFPTVPMRRAGIRLSVNANHEPADIERAIGLLARHVPEVLAREGLSRAELDGLFARAVVSSLGGAPEAAPGEAASPAPTEGARVVTVDGVTLIVERHATIATVARAEWDALLGTRGMISWEGMRLAERLFREGARPEHRWQFDYVVVRDAAGKPVCATVFTTALHKDDFLMRDEVSREVERRREADPYLLTSKVVMSGSTLSEGHHVFIDRGGPWRPALRELLAVAEQIHEREQAQAVMLREMPAGDGELDAFMLEQGFVAVPTLPSHVLPLEFRDEEDLVRKLSKGKRNDVRKVIAAAPGFIVESFGEGSQRRTKLPAGQVAELHGLYVALARRKFKINIFELPDDLLPELLTSPVWEVVTLKLRPEAGGPADGHPVAWFAGHMVGDHYGALVAGLDPDYVLEHGAYRQMLLQLIKQAKRRGARVLHMGMDADIEKSRYRTRMVENCVYVQVREHYNEAVLRDIVAEVGVAQLRRGGAV